MEITRRTHQNLRKEHTERVRQGKQLMRISPAEVTFANLSLVDEGPVFWWNGKLFRAIRAEHHTAVQQLFSSGLIDALVQEGVFVPSRITDYKIDRFELVIQHQIVDVISYPREWSFSMLKDAALLILRVNEIANGFGYQTKNCQTYNVRFVGEKPLYIDLESFIPVQTEGLSMFALDEFLRAYYFPIKIWSSVGVTLGSKVVQKRGLLLETEEYLRCRWPIFRWAIADPVGKLVSKVYKSCSQTDELFREVRKRHPAWKVFLADRCRSHRRRLASIEGLRRRIQRVQRRADKTNWSDYYYQIGIAQQNGEISLSPRIQYIADLLVSLGVPSILEIAGNQGLLSRALKRMNSSIRVTCTDADESALDQGFSASKKEGVGVNWAVLNPFLIEMSTDEDSPTVRFQADAVVVMGLSHHLVLSQRFQIEWVLDQLSQYCRNYLLIEFMPLGLNSPNVPPVPAWYTREWFQKAFEVRFNFISRTQIEDNRILFVGTKKVDSLNEAPRNLATNTHAQHRANH